MKILNSFEIFEILKILNYKKKIIILKFKKKWNVMSFSIFWNFEILWKFLILEFDLSLDNVETPNRPTEAHARWTHSEVQPRKYCLGHSANSKIPYHLIASTESSTATWACACNPQSALWWDWNPFVRKLIKVGSLGENAKNKKKSLQ